jgi:hypothetical protein
MKLASATSVLIFAISLASDATAGHETPLYTAACQYRDAVREFERGVFRAHCFGRYDERLVDRLEDATGRLRSATRHPDDLDRLFYEWGEVECLQPRVQAAIFNITRYPHDPQLAECWSRVLCSYERLAHELLVLQAPHSHRLHHGAATLSRAKRTAQPTSGLITFP